MNTTHKLILLGACLLCALLGGLWYFTVHPASRLKADDEGATYVAEAEIEEGAATRSSKPRHGKRIGDEVEADEAEDELEEEEEEFVDAWVEDLPKADRELGQRLVDAADKDDLPALKKMLSEIRACANPDVRERYIDALNWFDKAALTELTVFLMDPNKEVAEAAFNAWDSAIDLVEDEQFRIEAATMALNSLSDKDSLATVATKIETADDRKAALEALADVAEGGNPAALEAVKESYSFITGEDWQDAATARAKALTIDNEDTEK